jgi:hypothetical protein
MAQLKMAAAFGLRTVLNQGEDKSIYFRRSPNPD